MGNKLSLSWELGELRQAIEAARMLIDHLAHHHLFDGYSQRVAASAAASVLWLVDSRMLDLGRVLRGELDPARMVTPYNRSEPLEADDPDHYFEAWNLDQIKSELERIERGLQAREREQDNNGET